MVENIAGLALIPPPKGFNWNSKLLQGCHGLLDLHLHSTMRERKGDVAVEKDLHDSK